MAKPYNVETIPDGHYRHYKGGIYYVEGTTLHTETQETLVLYRNMERQSFARPLAMWNETVDVDGEQHPRFEFIGDTRRATLVEMSQRLADAEERERVASRILAQGKDALVEAGVLEPRKDTTECALVVTNGLSGIKDCKACGAECLFDEVARRDMLSKR